MDDWEAEILRLFLLYGTDTFPADEIDYRFRHGDMVPNPRRYIEWVDFHSHNVNVRIMPEGIQVVKRLGYDKAR